jgi:hypothetical protein
MTDEQILEAAKLINAKRRLSEYHQSLHRGVVSLLDSLNPELTSNPITSREQSSIEIQTIQEANGYMASEGFRLDSAIAKELLEHLKCILSKKEQLL